LRSIGQQLGAGLIAILLITVVLVGQGSVWLFDRALRIYLQDVLQRETDSLLAALTPGTAGLYLDYNRIDPDYQRPFSGRYFVVDGHERWRSRSLWDQRLPLNVQGLQNTLIDGPRGQQLLVLNGRYVKLGEPVRISVAIDYQPLLTSLERAKWWIWGLGGLSILLSVLLQQWLLKRSLQPLRMARQELAEWRSGQRLDLNEVVPEELQPLVAEINHLGRQIEQTLKRSRSGLGDLGHALKTPLAVLDSNLQQQLEHIDPLRLATMQAQVASMQQQLERALQRARLAPERQAGDRFDPQRDLQWLIASLQSVHGGGCNLECLGDAASEWPFEREDMLELLGNLLDNACKWSAGNVLLSWEQTATGMLVKVEDDGPGIVPENREAVLRRGSRLDESVNGHGLGLAIVSDMVEVYEGRISLSQSHLGGLQIEVFLPRQRKRF